MAGRATMSSGRRISAFGPSANRYDARMDTILSGIMIIGIFYMVYYITDGL